MGHRYAEAGERRRREEAGDRHRHRGSFGPWGPPFGPGRRHRMGGRARRGDVRAAILMLLAERPMHGYEIIQEVGGRTGGVWEPSPGSVYPTLQMLEDEGLVTAQESEGRKRYALTEQGKAEAERRSTDPAPWDEVTRGASSATMDVRRLGFQIFGAVKQIGETGTEQQLQSVVEILTETRKRLYKILAEDE
ncbi:MAG TPA: PadR family transcriptional regulator [Actinomycetota bacterium]|nr:PadR family transcriptional regulator [Actinomycetota bacterium]